jgi:hypothetical protein
LLQREELQLQRKELELTRGELSRTASAQEASQKELSTQADTLHKTAQINAINTVIGIYKAQREVQQVGTGGTVSLNPKVFDYLKKLEALIEDLNEE